MVNCNQAEYDRQHLIIIVTRQNVCQLVCSLDLNSILLKINENEQAFTFTCLCAVFTVAIATAAASLATILIDWCSLPFGYIAKKATTEGEKCQLFDGYE